MSKMIVQVLVGGIISALLVASPAAAKTAKQPPPASEVKAKRAVPNETVKAVQEALDKEDYKLKADGLMGNIREVRSSLTRRKTALG